MRAEKMKLFSTMKAGFVYYLVCRDKHGIIKWKTKERNLIPLVGVNYIVGAAMAGVSQYTSWYMGLSETSYTPVAAETLATLLVNAPECQKYSGGQRKLLSPDTVSDGVYANITTPAEFVFTSSASIKLLFISTGITQLNTTGLLISVVQLSSPKVAAVGETVTAMAGMQLTAA